MDEKNSVWTDDGAGLPEIWDDPAEAGPDGEEPAGAEEESPAADGPDGDDGRVLRFRARVDREDRDVTLSERELPSVYQKSQVADRWREQRDRYAAQASRADAFAREMGYGSAEEMFGRSGAAETAPDAGGETAEDQLPPQAPDFVPQGNTDSARDYRSEALAFFTARPELAGRELPDGVVRRWAAGEPLARAYESAEQDSLLRQTERLRRENQVLRQNASAAVRAPVRGVFGGGPTDLRPLDPFLEGLEGE